LGGLLARESGLKKSLLNPVPAGTISGYQGNVIWLSILQRQAYNSLPRLRNTVDRPVVEVEAGRVGECFSI
jgi:hypothetical protein